MSQRHQKIWNSLRQDTRSLRIDQRKKEVQQALEETAPTPQEKGVGYQKESEKKEDDLACELQLSPMNVDKVLVNGKELTKDSSIATLRAACSFLGISGSGSKVQVYTKILNHNKKMELLNAKSLVSEAKAQETREALGQSVPKMLDEAIQAKAQADLTHMPYANWCKERIEHRARPDRHERTNGVKRGSIPEVSFDFCYTRARGSETKSARAVCWLVAIDSQTGFIHVVPLGSKGQFHLIVQELIHFSKLLGYSAITYGNDNEPATRQTLKTLINTRHSLGLTTRLVNS